VHYSTEQGSAWVNIIVQDAIEDSSPSSYPYSPKCPEGGAFSEVRIHTPAHASALLNEGLDPKRAVRNR
jgi:hypothetical protein